MQMNKLYLLVALGLSVKAYESDCLVPESFDPSLGSVSFNCGSECYYSGTGGGGGTTTGCTNYYSNYCADDDYMCQEAGTYCNEMSYGASDCLTNIGLCEDYDSACLSAAACLEAADYGMCGTYISTATCIVRKEKKVLKETMDKYYFVSGVTLFGSDTTGTAASCYHTHLYSFFYSAVTPQGVSDWVTDLVVSADVLVGSKGVCVSSNSVAYTTGVSNDYTTYLVQAFDY